ncbi:MAG: hypothetical protein ACP5DZ_02470 [Bacteroidales bacterium]
MTGVTHIHSVQIFHLPGKSISIIKGSVPAPSEKPLHNHKQPCLTKILQYETFIKTGHRAGQKFETTGITFRGIGKIFDIWLAGDELHFLKSIPNLHKNDDEDTGHGNPVKGNNISNLLKQENVHILVSKYFGQNIKIVSQFFLPVIVFVTDVKKVVVLLENNVGKLIEASTTHLKSLNQEAYILK